MKVTELSVRNFRNIKEAEIVPHEGVNVIFGENAQGKTNLLESIWLFTVSVTADESRSSAERLCDCHLCGSNVRRNSGRPFHQNRERIAALALQSRDWEESRP